MADDKCSQFCTHAQQNKSVFVFRMIGIEKLHCLIIEKNRTSFFKGHSVFFLVGPILLAIPFETQFVH